MRSLILLSPEIFLSALALVVLLGEAFFPNKEKIWIPVAIVGLIASAVPVINFFSANQVILKMITVDSMAMFFKLTIIIAVVIVLWLSIDYREFADASLGLYAGVMLLGTVGLMLLVGASDLLMTVIALELISITSFILTGFVMKRRSSSEGAIKFFLVGTFSSALVLYGISYYYGYFGTTSYAPLQNFATSGQASYPMLSLLLIFLIAGFGFKLAMVPFHMWAPDAYEAAPTPIAAFLSVAPKAATVGFFIRFFSGHEALHITPVLAVLAAITMTVGNLGALHQTNMKRLIAYSSIAQVGYILVAFVAGGSLGTQAAMAYTLLYLFMNLGLFAALILISNQNQSDDMPTFAGLIQISMPLALIVVVFLASLAGLPPMGGFIGKFTIFAAIMKKPELLWLGVIAVLNSVVSLYYYFRIAQQMFFRDAANPSQKLKFSPALLSSLVVTSVVTLVAGVFPNCLLTWIKNIVGS